VGANRFRLVGRFAALGFALALPAFGQGVQPPVGFREIRFADPNLEGPAIVCQPAPIPAVTSPNAAPSAFLAECSGHRISGTIEIDAPPFLPEGFVQAGESPDYRLSSPVRASARLEFTWTFNGLGPGSVSPDIQIGGEAGPDGSLNCVSDSDGVDVAENVDSAGASVELACDVSAVYTAATFAPAEFGLPEGSLVLEMYFHFGWLPSIFRENPPPDVGGAIGALVIYGGAAGAGADVSMAALEMVQTVQTAPAALEPANVDPARRMPLAALKSSMLRVYLRGAETVEDGVLVKVAGRRNGVPLAGSPLAAGPLNVGPPDRSSAAGSVNIPLPLNWTEQGALELTAEAELLNGAVDPNEDDNSIREVFEFASTAAPGEALDVFYLPACYQRDGAGPVFCPDDNTGGIGARLPISRFADLTAKLLPLPYFGLVYRRLAAPPPVYPNKVNEDNIHLRLDAMRRFYNHIDIARRGRIDQLFFWLPPEVTTDSDGTLGMADALWDGGGNSGRVAWGANISEDDPFEPQRTLAHELGHDLGLRHTNTENGCGATDEATDYLRRGTVDKDIPLIWTTSGDSRTGETGFDPVSGEFQPSERWDIMSYCTPSDPGNQEVWISPYHYKKLFENCFQGFAGAGGRLSGPCMRGNQISYGRAAPLLAAPQQVSEADYLIISGSAKADGSSGRLDPVFRVRSSTTPDPVGPAGDHCLVLTGAAGRLAEHCFTLSFHNPETFDPIDEDHFSIRIPAPAGATRIALTRDGRELAAAQASAAAPQVAIAEPSTGDRWEGGMQSVRWDSSDADGDARTFAVHYSPDGGGVWLPLDIDRRETELEVDPSQIEGGNNVLVRVLGSDGFNTTETRVGPIQVVQTPRIEVADRLDLHNALVGQAVERVVTVRNPGSGPLTIASVTSSNSVVVVTTPAPIVLWAGESRDIQVRFTPPSAGPHMGTLALQSDDSLRPRVEVVFEGQGITESTAEVVAAVSAIDFGSVNVGETAERTLTFENFGPALATVNSIATTPTAFSVQGLATPYQLGVRREHLVVTFTPAAAGRVEGRATIRTSGPNQAVIEVALSGTGLAASGGGPRPAIHRNGVVDAASYAATLAPGGIASIFGAGLASGVAGIVSTPLPTNLGGVRVLVDGRAAPLFYVSPGQINFQAPYEVRTSGQLSIVVERDGVASAAEAAQVAPNAPAVFTNGAGEPAAQRNPALDTITAANPARPGDVLTLFVTGIGELSNQPASGSPAPGGPLAHALRNARVTVGGVSATVYFAGLTPGFVGLGQINFEVPQFAAIHAIQSHKSQRAGQSVTALPLVVEIGINSSRPVNLPVEGAPQGPGQVTVRLDEVLPQRAVIADHLVVRYTVRKPAGVGGMATLRVFLGTTAAVSTHDTLLHEHFIELSNAGDEQLTESGITLLDILTPRNYFVAVQLEVPGDPDPANNLSASLPFEIVSQRPAFDASLQLTAVTPQQAGPGDSLTLEYVVSAAEGLTATLQRSVYLSADPAITAADTLLNTRTLDIIDGAADIISHNNFLPRDLVPGDYFVGIILEPEGDRNPANNVAAGLPVRVTAGRIPFDIGVTLTDVSPRQAAAGGALAVRYSVQNLSAASGIFTREIRLSSDAVITRDDTLVNTRTFTLFGDAPDLISENNVIPAGAAPGAYFIGLIVDTAGDTNASNNTSPTPIPITVTAPAAALTASPQGSAPAATADPKQQRAAVKSALHEAADDEPRELSRAADGPTARTEMAHPARDN
jgi:uncharacterized protein (TIGR03437 family)